jgi:hypothetical protein
MKKMKTVEYNTTNRNDEILFEEFLELTERELRFAGIQLVERVTVGNFTSHKFTDSDENVYTIKSWVSDNGTKYPTVVDKFYFNGIETNASTPMAHY